MWKGLGLHSREINLSQGEPCHPAAANVDERSGCNESQSVTLSIGGEVERVHCSSFCSTVLPSRSHDGLFFNLFSPLEHRFHPGLRLLPDP